MRKITHLVFIALVVLCLAHAAYYYPLLPERVASHFGATGQPDGWTGKASFLEAYLTIAAVNAVLFSLAGYLLSRVPDKLISLPNRDYWLSPERRQRTFDFLSRWFLWFGSATLLMLMDGFHQTFRVNIGKAAALEHPLTSLVVYLLFTAVWTIGMIAKFMKKP